MDGLGRIVAEHPFFGGLDLPFRELIAGCAKNVRFEAGEHVYREGGDADAFYLIREGRVALEIATGEGPVVTFQTLNPGEILGASWLVPPYKWNFDARAVERVRAISLDAVCLRTKCEENHDLGWDLMTRFVPELNARMHAAQLQLLDVYGRKS